MGDHKGKVEAMRQAVEMEPHNQHFARKLAEFERDDRRFPAAQSSPDASVAEYSFASMRGGEGAAGDSSGLDAPHYSPFAGLRVSVATAQGENTEDALFSSLF